MFLGKNLRFLVCPYVKILFVCLNYYEYVLHPSKNEFQWLVDAIVINFALSMQRGEAPQVQALACGPQHGMFVSQEDYMKKVSRKLKSVCDVVAQVKINLDICFFIRNSVMAISFRHS
jgi:hypothetical protein